MTSIEEGPDGPGPGGPTGGDGAGGPTGGDGAGGPAGDEEVPVPRTKGLGLLT